MLMEVRVVVAGEEMEEAVMATAGGEKAVAEGGEEKASAGVATAGVAKDEVERGEVEKEEVAVEGRAGRAGVLGKLWGGLVVVMVAAGVGGVMEAAETAKAEEGLATERVAEKVAERVAARAVKAAVVKEVVAAGAMAGVEEVLATARVEDWVEAMGEAGAGKEREAEETAGAAMGGRDRLASRCCCIPRKRNRGPWCNRYLTRIAHGSSMLV
jgi:hypothetical protein